MQKPRCGQQSIKEILESIGEIMDVLKEGRFQKITPMPVFVLSPVHANLLDGLKYLCAMIALLSEWKYDVVITAPNREVEARNLRRFIQNCLNCGQIYQTPRSNF